MACMEWWDIAGDAIGAGEDGSDGEANGERCCEREEGREAGRDAEVRLCADIRSNVG